MKKATPKQSLGWRELALGLTALGLIIIAYFVFLTPKGDTAYIDVNVLFEEYKGTKASKKNFEAKKLVLQSNVDSLLNDWKKELKYYEKERSSMSKKELALKQELLSNKQQQINGYQQAIQKQIREEEQKLTQTVFNQLNAYIKEYGKEKGYKYILGATGSGGLLYADETDNITEEVLKGLNQEYQGE